jgi:hypothetical protein
MVKNEKNILEIILNKNGLYAAEEILVQDLVNVLQKKTLGNKVGEAINQRKQGHFDKAMLNISEANRDQVLSIRTIQSIIDKIKGVSKTEIIFEKYRQFYPFQIGLTNGKDVLELLNLLKLECDFALEELINDLYKNEEMVGPMLQELDFFETRIKGRISKDEIYDLKMNVENITEKIFAIKTSLIDYTCRVVQKKYTQMPIEDKISLIKNIYIVISSSVQTMDASFVKVEKNT